MMKTLFAAIGALALATSAASAEPVHKNTITGYAASAAVADGVPLNRSPRARHSTDEGYRAAVPGGTTYDQTPVENREPNRGAGTSRSNDANNG